MSGEERQGYLLNAVEKHQRVLELYQTFQQEVIDLCRGVWATFDLDSMNLGMVMMIAVCICLIITIVVDIKHFPHFEMYTSALTVAIIISASSLLLGGSSVSFEPFKLLVGYPACGALFGYLCGVCRQAGLQVQWKNPGLLTNMATVFMFLHGAGLFSNSYIEAQDDMVQFLLISFMFLYVSL